MSLCNLISMFELMEKKTINLKNCNAILYIKSEKKRKKNGSKIKIMGFKMTACTDSMSNRIFMFTVDDKITTHSLCDG